MNLKISWIEINQELLPHSDLDSEDDLNTISNEILEAFEIGGYSEEVQLDEKIILIASTFTSKLIGDIPKIIKIYELGRWGKLFSGDTIAVIGESITYALLIQLFDIDIADLVPFRNVKYLGTISDLAINIEKYDKLKKFLGTDKGILFVNARATMIYKRSYIAKRIAESLTAIENVRYPDNYGLISYIIKYNQELYDLCIIVKP